MTKQASVSRIASIAAVSAAIGIALIAPATASAESDPELQFIDLRLQGGVAATTGVGASMTLMCGNIGDKDQHVVDTYQDFGIVVGFRARAAAEDAKPEIGSTVQRNVVDAVIMLGLGYYAGPSDHLEFSAGYGIGETSGNEFASFRKDGTSKLLIGEVGWYHTMLKHIQIGAIAGYSYDKLKLNVPGGSVPAKAQGVDLALEIGYRF